MVTIQTSYSTLRHLSKRNGHTYIHEQMFTAFNGSYHHGSRLETTQMLISRWMAKQTVVFPYGGILVINGEKNPKLLIHVASWINLRNCVKEEMLSDRKQITKGTDSVIPLTWNPRAGGTALQRQSRQVAV